MKTKWMKVLEKLGKTKIKQTSDGLFMTDSEMDQIAEMHEENETFAAAVQSEKDLRIAAENALNDEKTAGASREQVLKDQIVALESEKNNLKEENDALKATETVAKDKKDPELTGEKSNAKSKWDVAYEKSAAALRGESGVDMFDDDDDGIAPENRTKVKDSEED